MEEEDNKISLLDLPPEILVYILCYLGETEAVAKIAKTCKTFNILVFQGMLLFKSIFSDSKTATFFVRSCPNYRDDGIEWDALKEKESRALHWSQHDVFYAPFIGPLRPLGCFEVEVHEDEIKQNLMHARRPTDDGKKQAFLLTEIALPPERIVAYIRRGRTDKRIENPHYGARTTTTKDDDGATQEKASHHTLRK